MSSESANEKLQNLILDLKEEKREIDRQIQNQEDEISQRKKYLESLHEKESMDVSFFSPRNVESRYKDTIENSKQVIQSLVKENQKLYSKQNVLDKRIAALCEIQDSDLLSYAIRVVGSDRKRISSELHDTVIQDLVHSIHKIELCQKYMEHDQIQAKLELVSIEKYLRETIQKARDLICDIRPMNFDDFGFRMTLLNAIEELQKNTTMVITAEVDEFPIDHIDKYIFLYRIAMELIRNAIYHSGGSRIFLSTKKEGHQVKLVVSDDGHGFSVKDDMDKHFGLEFVKERVYLMGGSLHIDSTDHGSCVEVTMKD